MYTDIVAGFKIQYTNKKEYKLLRDEIFNKEIYSFSIDNQTPTIVDIGSHIGLSVLYFKFKFPNSKIVCFEPNPKVFGILKENIFINNLTDVEIVNKGVNTKAGDIDLHIDDKDDWYSTGSIHKGSWMGNQITVPIKISCDTLNSIIKAPIDILKLDVEGIEEKLLVKGNDYLKLVENIVFEYHPRKDNNLRKILKVLKEKGFKNIQQYVEGELTNYIIFDVLCTIKATKKVNR